MNWEDATSYSRGQRGKIEPNAYSITSGKIRVFITSNHIYYRGEWALRCPVIGIDITSMNLSKDTDLTIVKEKALKIVSVRLKQLQMDMNNLYCAFPQS